MSCINCGHGKDMHDSDGDERMEKEWCNVESCECTHYLDEEAAEQSFAADSSVCEGCGHIDGYHPIWCMAGE